MFNFFFLFFRPMDHWKILNVLKSPNQWKSLTVLDLYDATCTSYAVQVIGRNFSFLKELSVSCTDATDHDFCSLIFRNISLRRFYFSTKSGQLQLDSLRILFNICRKLTHFHLKMGRSCRFYSDHIKTFETVFKSLPSNLIFLSIDAANCKISQLLEPLLCSIFAPNLICASLRYMPTVAMPKLRQLFVNEFQEITYSSMELMETCWLNFPNLKSFKICHSHTASMFPYLFTLPSCPVTDLGLRRFCSIANLPSLKNFTSLDFKYTEKLYPDMIKTVVLANPNLKFLALPRLELFDMEKFACFIVTNCKQLKMLDITTFTARRLNYYDFLEIAMAHTKATSDAPVGLEVVASRKKNICFYSLLCF